jgi:hypothetical protein
VEQILCHPHFSFVLPKLGDCQACRRYKEDGVPL